MHHCVQQTPAGVGHQLQQRFVDSGQRHFGVGGGLAVGQFDIDRHLRLAAHRIAFLVGFHAHVKLVRFGADADFSQSQPESRFAQIDQRGRCDIFAAFVPERSPPFTRGLETPGEKAVPRHFAQPPAQRQHADIHVRPPAFLHLQAKGRVLAIELHDLRFNDAFAFNRHQRGRKPERHAHLEYRRFAGLIAFFLGQHVHAVVILAAKPEFALARDVDRAGGLNALAVFVFGRHDQLDFARFAEFGFAQQQAACVAFAAANAAEVFGLGLVVVGVEAADHALAAGGDDAGHGFHFQRHAGSRLAGQVQRQRLKLDFLAARCPAFGLDAGDHASGPQGGDAANRLHFAVRVGVGGFEQQLLRLLADRHVAEGQLARAVAVQRERLFVGNHALVLRGGVFFFAFRVFLAHGARRGKAEFAVVGVVQALAAHQRRHPHRQVDRRAARNVVDLHIDRHGLDIDQRLFARRVHAP